MRFWFDADNAPHVLVMRPIAQELIRQGHEVVFTARDRASTCRLMDMYALEYTKVGAEYRPGKLGKVLGTLERALALASAMRGKCADVSFGHGSRALPLASAMLRIPSVTMYDYEWVNPSLFNLFCRKILLPEAIDLERCREAGIRTEKVVHYPSYKECLYLDDFQPDRTIARELGLRDDSLKVLLRPPATTAHYHNPEAERILAALLEHLLHNPDVQLVWLPRSKSQEAMLPSGSTAQIVRPTRPYPGPQLIENMDIVIGGGGTMTREAALLGIRSISFFRGRLGRVDERLSQQGRLKLIESADEAPEVLDTAREASTPAELPSPLPAVLKAICSCRN